MTKQADKRPLSVQGLFAQAHPRVVNISPGRPFIDILAQALLRNLYTEDDPLAPAEAMIFVPNRRIASALQDALVQRLSRAAVLPQIRPLGDIEDEDLFVLAPGLDDAIEAAAPMSALKRETLLARLIAKWNEARGAPAPFSVCLAFARNLAELLDTFYLEEIEPARLETLVPDIFAEHWRQTLEFLSIITHQWPEILSDEGEIDERERARRLTSALATRWNAQPPSFPVIAAGSTGAAPAVRRLLASIAAAPSGAVILPGLDVGLDDRAWDAIDAPHSQFLLKKLIAKIGVKRADIPELDPEDADPLAPRRRLVSLALYPGNATDLWPRDVAALKSSAAAQNAAMGLTLAGATHEDQEALIAALMIREALDDAAANIAVVTPDRALARRLISHLARWDITALDTAGTPFNLSASGTFLQLVARCAVDPSDPATLAALLKHRLCALDDVPATTNRAARDFERRILRDRRNAPRFKRFRLDADSLSSGDETLIARLDGAIAPLTEALAAGAPARICLRRHIEAAQQIAGTPGAPGAEILWSDEAGSAGARHLRRLIDALDDSAIVSTTDYPQAFNQLMEGCDVRAAGDAPVRIFGPLEARFQAADRVILCGLNDGVWPRDAAIDPWLNRSMREALDLPSPERRIGLSSHDFQQLACASNVAMTWSENRNGKPAAPSRWVQRLQLVLNGLDLWMDVDRSARYRHWAEDIDRPARYAPEPQPRPRPPVAARPRRLSVTEVETWFRDPYSIYAKHILGLRALDPLRDVFDAAQYGTVVHLVLKRFVEDNPDSLPGDAVERLTDLARRAFWEAGASEREAAYWRARFEAAIPAYLAYETAQRSISSPVALERKGAVEIAAPAASFKLTARADRIDRTRGDDLIIIDYKTGAAPSLRQLTANFSPQLPLEAMIAHEGGFEDLPAGAIAEMVYVKIGAKSPKDHFSTPPVANGENIIETAWTGFRNMIAAFDDPDTPYLSQPRPQWENDYGDYDRLARRKEWSTTEGGEE